MEKHAPKSREELVVHKDKIAAVDTWLQAQISLQQTLLSHCLLITGEHLPKQDAITSAVAAALQQQGKLHGRRYCKAG